MLDQLLKIDTNLFCLLNGFHSPFFDTFFSIITWFGTAGVAGPCAIAFVLWKVPRSRLKRVFLIAALATIATSICTTSIKQIVQRPRPPAYFAACAASEADSVFVPHIVGERLQMRSFPSGHTATAFTAAAMCAFAVGGWGFIAFVIAALVGYSRIYLGVHFPADVIAGAVIGTGVPLIFFGVIKIPKDRSLYD